MVKTLSAVPAARRQRLPLLHLNWPLLLGALLVGLVVFIAVAGPSIAPADPLKTNAILRVNGVWKQPPFAPFAVDGFPLGTDERGRDIYSLLLWAVRPTLVLVGVVAGVRLVAGLLIGLAAGWSVSVFGRSLDVLISTALTAPVLIVALGVVAVIGVDGGQGLWAFVIGLSLTGWAETARVVRELTRGVRGQPYVEAARALGASDAYLVRRHALPQVLPMAWVLLAFEVSGTILTVAGLGFLGYFTNDVWAMISDTVAQRFAGLPDLGQMLSTVSNDIFTGPYKMFMAGSMVFITVLGFNLLGAGLRQQLNVERVRRRTQVTLVREWARDVVEDRVRPVLDTRPAQWAQNAIVLAALVVLVGYGFQYWRTNLAAAPGATAVLEVPGGQIWASERRDPYGTRWVDFKGPQQTPAIAWTFSIEGGFAGGPVVAADGTIYINALNSRLIALDNNGAVLWQAPLVETPVGTPAIGPGGVIFVAGAGAGLTAISPEGRLLWHMAASAPGEATGSPIVSADGTIYYTVAGQIQAATSFGEPLWRENAYVRRVAAAPMLTADGYYIYLRGTALASPDGSPVIDQTTRRPDQFITGADGQDYLRVDHLLSHWTTDKGVLQVGETLTWNFGNYAFGSATDAGVLPDGSFWIAYLPPQQDARFVYVQPDGQVAGFVRHPFQSGLVVGLDEDKFAYLCGSSFGQAGCLALRPGQDEPVWALELPGGTLLGGALAPGWLYAATAEGYLSAIGPNAP